MKSHSKEESLVWHPGVVFPVFIVTFFVARLLPRALEEASALRLPVALLVLPALLYLVLAMRHWLSRMDELQQRVQTEAYLWSLILVLTATATLHLLQKAGYLAGIEYFDVVCFSYLAGVTLGYLRGRRRYGLTEAGE